MTKMTTIKLSVETKERLDAYKHTDETYEEALDRILKKQEIEQALIEGYKNQELDDEWKDWDATVGDGL